MTEVYSVEKGLPVAGGGSYVKVGLHYEVPNCLNAPGQELQLNERCQLREAGRPALSVVCIGLPQPGIQTASFR